MRIVRMTVTGAFVLPAALFALPAAVAAELVDPTKPPASIVGDVGTEADSGAPVLQSVLIGAGRREAVINGQTVRVGQKYGEARVVKIAESEVILRTGKEMQVLKLFPNIEKRPAIRKQDVGPGKLN